MTDINDFVPVMPNVGDKFDITPDLFDTLNHEIVIVTDVQVTPTGFLVEGLPVDRDPDDFSLLVREFATGIQTDLFQYEEGNDYRVS